MTKPSEDGTLHPIRIVSVVKERHTNLDQHVITLFAQSLESSGTSTLPPAGRSLDEKRSVAPCPPVPQRLGEARRVLGAGSCFGQKFLGGLTSLTDPWLGARLADRVPHVDDAVDVRLDGGIRRVGSSFEHAGHDGIEDRAVATPARPGRPIETYLRCPDQSVLDNLGWPRSEEIVDEILRLFVAGEWDERVHRQLHVAAGAKVTTELRYRPRDSALRAVSERPRGKPEAVVSGRVDGAIEGREHLGDVNFEFDDKSGVVPGTILNLMVPPGILVDAAHDKGCCVLGLLERSEIPSASTALEHAEKAVSTRPSFVTVGRHEFSIGRDRRATRRNFA